MFDEVQVRPVGAIHEQDGALTQWKQRSDSGLPVSSGRSSDIVNH